MRENVNIGKMPTFKFGKCYYCGSLELSWRSLRSSRCINEQGYSGTYCVDRGYISFAWIGILPSVKRWFFLWFCCNILKRYV